MLDLDLLRTFVAVADQGSFTRAASALHCTQSAVSMQIRRLEERLGAALLLRGRGGVGLTAAGEGLIGHARRMLVLNEEAIGRVRAHDTAGRVRLGVMDDYGSLLLPSMLARFADAFPRIRVEMETGLTARMAERLGGDFDLVVAMHPVGEGGGALLRRDRALWAGSAAHDVHAMRPLPVALYPQGCLFRQWALAALDAAGLPWRLAFVSHSLAAVEAIAGHGLAVTVVKEGTFPARLVRLGPAEGLPPLPEADIRLHRAPGLGRAGALLADHLAASFAGPAAPLS